MRKEFIIPLIISVGCLYAAFRGISFGEVWHALQQAHLSWVGLAVCLNLLGYALRSLRWEQLMAPVKPIPARELFKPLVLGFFANNVLPFRMGELARAHIAGRKFGISRTASLGTIVLERLFDMISFVVIFLSIMFFFPFPEAIRRAAFLMGAGCTLFMTVLWLGSRHQDFALRLFARLPLSAKWNERVQRLFSHFNQGVSGLSRASAVFKTILLSFCVWTCEATFIFIIAQAFPITFTFPQAFFLLFFLGLSVALPQAPGYVGTMEFFGTSALFLLGIPREQGLPVILTIHGTQFAIVISLGFYMLWSERLSFRSLVTSDAHSQPT
jgi:glycosyltransferase 2 family protein